MASTPPTFQRELPTGGWKETLSSTPMEHCSAPIYPTRRLQSTRTRQTTRTPATTAPVDFPLFPARSSARAALAPAPPPSSQEPAPRQLPRFSPATRSGLPFIDATTNERSPFLLPARPANRRAPSVIFGSSTSLGYFRCCWLFQGLLARSQRRCFFFPGSEPFRML